MVEVSEARVEGGRSSEISGCDFGDVRSGDEVQEGPGRCGVDAMDVIALWSSKSPADVC